MYIFRIHPRGILLAPYAPHNRLSLAFAPSFSLSLAHRTTYTVTLDDGAIYIPSHEFNLIKTISPENLACSAADNFFLCSIFKPPTEPLIFIFIYK